MCEIRGLENYSIKEQIKQEGQLPRLTQENSTILQGSDEEAARENQRYSRLNCQENMPYRENVSCFQAKGFC